MHAICVPAAQLVESRRSTVAVTVRVLQSVVRRPAYMLAVSVKRDIQDQNVMSEAAVKLPMRHRCHP